MSEWIAVEERLPERNLHVLIHIPADLMTDIGYLDEADVWVHSDGWSVVEQVTHWMPMPADPVFDD